VTSKSVHRRANDRPRLQPAPRLVIRLRILQKQSWTTSANCAGFLSINLFVAAASVNLGMPNSVLAT
jgi:hypothetical protein